MIRRMSKMKRNSQKITVTMDNDTLRLADESISKLGCSNRSELIEKAVRAYLGKDLLKEFSQEIASVYGAIERSEIKNMEERMAKLSYKIAIEMAQVHVLLASFCELTYRDTQEVRKKAVKLVNETRGFITLPKAIRNSVELEGMEEY